MVDEILAMSQVTWPSDEILISSGMSRCHGGDESIEIVQYMSTQRIDVHRIRKLTI